MEDHSGSADAYRHLSDGELKRIALDHPPTVPDERAALAAELRSRASLKASGGTVQLNPDGPMRSLGSLEAGPKYLPGCLILAALPPMAFFVFMALLSGTWSWEAQHAGGNFHILAYLSIPFGMMCLHTLAVWIWNYDWHPEAE